MNAIFFITNNDLNFNNKYSPFIKICDITLIEYTIKPFFKYKDKIENYYFIYRKSEEIKYNIKEKLQEMFYYIDFHCIIIDDTKNTTFETIINEYKINGQTIICNCDNSTNIEPLIQKIEDNKNAQIIMTLYNEKQPDTYVKINCLYVQDINLINKCNLNIESIYDFCSNTQIKKDYAIIKKTSIYTDLKTLEKCVDSTRDEKCIFVDLDGTLIKQVSNPDYIIENQQLLDGTIEQLTKYKNLGYYIVITTARKKPQEVVEKILTQLKIPYDRIINDIPSGPRILINDIKPTRPFYDMARQINVIRDKGINDINLEFEKVNIIKYFKGGSCSNAVLIEKNGKVLVRKYIYKNESKNLHYKKLKKQYNDLKTLNFFIENITPSLFDEYENDFIYYYDMEYLDNYRCLYKITNKEEHILNTIRLFKNNLYSFKKTNHNENWLLDYIDRKINIDLYKNLNENIRSLIENEYVIINSVKLEGLNNIFNKLISSENLIEELNPKYLSNIHGDLTFENIMVCETTKNIKIIDTDQFDVLDAPELDLGKICQSLISKYELWSNVNNVILYMKNNIIDTIEFPKNIYNELNLIKNDWMEILDCNEKQFYKKAFFYLGVHLLRIIPYKYNTNIEHAIYALKEAIIYLNCVI